MVHLFQGIVSIWCVSYGMWCACSLILITVHVVVGYARATPERTIFPYSRVMFTLLLLAAQVRLGLPPIIRTLLVIVVRVDTARAALNICATLAPNPTIHVLVYCLLLLELLVLIHAILLLRIVRVVLLS